MQQAGDIDLIELGHAKSGVETDTFNYAIAYDRNNRKPLFYEAYPGGIEDTSVKKIYASWMKKDMILWS